LFINKTHWRSKSRRSNRSSKAWHACWWSMGSGPLVRGPAHHTPVPAPHPYRRTRWFVLLSHTHSRRNNRSTRVCSDTPPRDCGSKNLTSMSAQRKSLVDESPSGGPPNHLEERHEGTEAQGSGSPAAASPVPVQPMVTLSVTNVLGAQRDLLVALTSVPLSVEATCAILRAYRQISSCSQALWVLPEALVTVRGGLCKHAHSDNVLLCGTETYCDACLDRTSTGLGPPNWPRAPSADSLLHLAPLCFPLTRWLFHSSGRLWNKVWMHSSIRCSPCSWIQ
jgi:hypothetical protein